MYILTKYWRKAIEQTSGKAYLYLNNSHIQCFSCIDKRFIKMRHFLYIKKIRIFRKCVLNALYYILYIILHTLSLYMCWRVWVSLYLTHAYLTINCILSREARLNTWTQTGTHKSSFQNINNIYCFQVMTSKL